MLLQEEDAGFLTQKQPWAALSLCAKAAGGPSSDPTGGGEKEYIGGKGTTRGAACAISGLLACGERLQGCVELMCW